MLTFTSHGGAGTVTGSRHLLTHGDTRLLVDCGLFQGLKNLRELNWRPLPVEPRTLDAVVLTHAHLDHSGYLPRLVRDGFGGKVHLTPATAEVAALILRDSAFLQEREAEFANRKGFSKHQPALPLYATGDAERAIAALAPAPLHRSIALPGNATLTFRRAGHMLGAATAQIDVAGRTVVFSGDLGRYGDAVMHDPEPVPEADTVVIESTYGDRRHAPADPVEALGAVIERTVQRGGTVVIPAFAVGRAQSLIHHYDDEHRLDRRDYEAACAAVTCVRDVAESTALSANRYPKVIISASGMATGGRVLHHIAAFAPDHRNTLLFSGFQAAGTRGRKLLDGAREVRIQGRWVPVAAEVVDLPMFSAHADSVELMRWLLGFHRPRRAHGLGGAARAHRPRTRLGGDGAAAGADVRPVSVRLP